MQDRSLTVTVYGRRWRLRFTRLRGSKHGWCDSPDKPSKQILINSQRRSRRRVIEDIIHEVLHAADWDKSEEWVTLVAQDLARILDRLETLGYIREVADEKAE